MLAGARGGHPAIDETLENGAMVIRVELKGWYSRRHRARPEENITRISKFRRKLLGDPSDKKLRTKGAETWGFLLYLLDTLETKLAVAGPGAAALLKAGRALEAMVCVWSSAGPVLTREELQLSYDHWKRFLVLTADMDECLIPKKHLGTHLAANIPRLGNPTRYANWHVRASTTS